MLVACIKEKVCLFLYIAANELISIVILIIIHILLSFALCFFLEQSMTLWLFSVHNKCDPPNWTDVCPVHHILCDRQCSGQAKI